MSKIRLIILLILGSSNISFSQKIDVFKLLGQHLPCSTIDSLHLSKIIPTDFAAAMYANSGCHSELYNLNFKKYNLEFPLKEEIISKLNKTNGVTLSTQNVFELIAERASNQEYLIINESHTRSAHRKFIETLLPYLYQIGYRNIGMEALNNFDEASTNPLFDTEMTERGVPIIGGMSGSLYLNDPSMSNVIRTGTDIGFQFFSYATRNKKRENGQVQNILKKTKKLAGKTLIICGHWHLLEKENDNKKWMAAILKDSLNQDVYTIDQTFFNFYNDREHARLFFKIDDAKSMPSLVTFNQKENLLNDFVDDFIYHPMTSFQNGRPNWSYNKNYQFIEVTDFLGKDIFNNYSDKILKIYRKNDAENVVPVDVLVLNPKAKKSMLYLPYGTYRAEIEISAKQNSKPIYFEYTENGLKSID